VHAYLREQDAGHADHRPPAVDQLCLLVPVEWDASTNDRSCLGSMHGSGQLASCSPRCGLGMLGTHAPLQRCWVAAQGQRVEAKVSGGVSEVAILLCSTEHI
jgi:hypothetical protein